MQDLLLGRKITAQEFGLLNIEKIELLNGEIICGNKMALLKLLIANVGLLNTLQLLPQEYWKKAMEQRSLT
ncbi:MAG: hypothetical protein ACYDBV_06045 [Nitrospiria bacterium]